MVLASVIGAENSAGASSFTRLAAMAIEEQRTGIASIAAAEFSAIFSATGLTFREEP